MAKGQKPIYTGLLTTFDKATKRTKVLGRIALWKNSERDEGDDPLSRQTR